MISDRDILGAVKEWINGKFGNVNNTSDADKPISTAQQEEFEKKVNKTDIMQGATSTAAGKAGLVPAPSLNTRDLILAGDGTFKDNGVIRGTAHTLNAAGWYRIAKISNASDGGGYFTPLLLMIGTSYSNTPDESHVLVVTGSQTAFNWKQVSGLFSVKRSVTKCRITKKSDTKYVELYYSVDVANKVSYTVCATHVGDSIFWGSLNFEPAESDETVVSEYTIPDKDDFDTSKSLTRFEEIPSGADLNSEKYMQAGNYVGLDFALSSLVNAPEMVTKEFYLTVTRFSNVVEQRFKQWDGVEYVRNGIIPFTGWLYNKTVMSYTGALPANKLWGTDANGNVGWIDPP